MGGPRAGFSTKLNQKTQTFWLSGEVTLKSYCHQQSYRQECERQGATIDRRKPVQTPEGTRSGEDRRIIERFTNSGIYAELMQIRRWVRGLALLFFALALSRLIVGAILAKPDSLAREIFNSICISIFAYFLFRYSNAIDRFLKNESLANLENSFERQSDFWRAIGVLAVIFAVVHFMFMF